MLAQTDAPPLDAPAPLPALSVAEGADAASAPPTAPSAAPPVEVARPARRRFRLARAYAAALHVALSYLGFGLVARLRGPAWAARRRPALHAKNGRRARRAILRLRGLFIKAGQLGSALTTLLPEPFRAELEGLQDRVPASPPAAARARIEAEFGAPPEALFAEWSALPVASASLAQVHRARLADVSGGDGQAVPRDVAVKVQHADIDAVARLDLRAIETILRAVGRLFGVRGLREQFAEIEAVILGELDFAREAENAAAIGRTLGRGVSVPAVVPERSTGRVLTTAFVDGIKAGDHAGLDAAGVDRRAVAERVLDAYGAMIFRDGLYHADPHPGNLLVVPDRGAPGGFELVFLDFGAVARLTPGMRRGLAEMIAGVIARDAARVTAALDVMGFTAQPGPAGAGRGSAEATAAVRRFVEAVHEKMLRGLDPRAFRLGDLTLDHALAQQALAFDTMADVGVSVSDLAGAFRVPRDWILLERTALLLIGLCGGLAPDVNPLRVIEPYVRPLTRDAARETLPAVVEAVWADVQAAGRSLLGLPPQLDRVLTRVEAGAVEVRQPDTVAATERLARAVRGLAASVGAVGFSAIAYWAYVGGDGGVALALAAAAAAFGAGALRR